MYFLTLFLVLGALQTTELRLGDNLVRVEIAERPEERAEGLKRREKLKEGEGMLFVFEEPRVVSFWMEETLIPLSVGFFDKKRALIEIHDMLPAQGEELFLYTSSIPVLYALEVPLGWFQKQKIELGAKFSFQRARD